MATESQNQVLKTCTKCKTPKTIGEFYAKEGGRFGVHAICSVCCREIRTKYHHSNPDKIKAYKLKKSYGITPERYQVLVDAQGGVCAICKKIPVGPRKEDRVLHIDHDHATGRVRGLLCGSHNLGLGKFRDDPALLRAAADYLEAINGR